MTRVFAAVENQEDAVLNQIENDVDIALEDGFCDTAQYSIEKLDDRTVKITDKVNNEVTKAEVKDGSCTLSELADTSVNNVPTELPELNLGDVVVWIDDSDNQREGSLVELNGDLVTIEPYNVPEGETVTLSRKQVRLLHEGDGQFARSEKRGESTILIIRIGDYDVEFDTKQKKATLVDDVKKLTWQFNPSQPLTQILKEAKAKVRSLDQKNLSKLSDATQKYFSTKHRQEVQDKIKLANFDKLSPKVLELIKQRYNLN